ncbi:MAG: polysaccharide deacetylase family protein [Myxococcota bacterium]|nr:polysaccharide deacetylase family protein [Myxococcota bacterium]
MPLTARNLCLHYLSRTAGERRLAITPEQLRDIVVAERAAGRTAAALSAYVGDARPSEAHFTISFDDAHRSVLELAAPVLRELEVPATLFVATAWIGTGHEWLDWDELRRLRELGWTIGAHSVTHPRMSWALYEEDAAAHAARLEDECARSRETIARELGEAPALFAYPYGEDPQIARDAVRAAGFAAALTVRDDCAWDGELFSIPRVDGMEAHRLVRAAEGEPLGISIVVPACDRTPILREVLSRLEAQSYPHELHEVIVVDDGSHEDLRAVIPDDPRFRLIASAAAGDRFRAGQARTRGAREARFPILAFLDADVAVGGDYLWALDWVHRRWERSVVLGYLSGYNLHDLGHVHTLEAVRGADPIERVPVIPDRQREPVARAVLDNVDWIGAPWTLCYTGNLSLPRALFDEVGAFPDVFEGWGLEDVDLGVRLHHASARFVFSRFALGYHLVDPSEPAPRNPFRRATPSPEDFEGYLLNLGTLRARHASDPAIAGYVERTLADIAETCGRPDTVGIEFGGASSLRPPFHAALHRVQPGGVPTEELLDRIEYAAKVGARRLWLCGGEPAEHPGFLPILREAKRRGMKVGMQTMGHPFADGSLASDARALGLDHVTVLVLGGDAERHEALLGEGTWTRFALGMEALREAGVHRSAHLVIGPGDDVAIRACEARLRDAGIEIDEVTKLDVEA